MGIYKDCDIRGVYGQDLNESTAYKIGRAVGSLMHGKRVVVGGDVRQSTPSLKENLMEGLMASGASLVDIGMVPTPVFYFARDFLKADGGIMVTASHNPAIFNGFKIALGSMPITKEDIEQIKTLADSNGFVIGFGEKEAVDVYQDYKDHIRKLLGHKGALKVVIDAGNGAVSKLAPELFRSFGYAVNELFCHFDGRFPNREPNPAQYNNLIRLQQVVIENDADIGIGFDGDGDRVVFIDHKGQIVTSEESFIIFIRDYLKNEPSTVVYDIKSSSIIEKEVRKYRSQPIMERSGHAFIKKSFLDQHAALAGEVSGHFFFKELGCDDGIYAALKMCEILTKSKKNLVEITEGIEKTIMTPDIRIPYPWEKQRDLLVKVESLKYKYPISTLDGIRVQFPYGWALIRQSVTEPCVTIRFEADHEENMLSIKKEFLACVPELYGLHEMLKY
ncbi:phosphomannomutase/phosphoglucomutase [Anaerosolibacter sp.]|uniref:phosphomannomutase/phosphoglucomutase n=1 Tax=Anaerosolibacter sp. TaxID=1872527 RepID=UPI0039EE73A9